MGTTKIMISIIVTIMFVFFSDNAVAQTKNETNAILTADHQLVMRHANAIVSGEAKTLNDQILEYNEARRSFADAKKTHTQLKKALSAKNKSVAIIHHDNIDKQHANATIFANAMSWELNSDKPDEAKLKACAKKLYDAIVAAETEHQALIRDAK
jgi:hypothetical protein